MNTVKSNIILLAPQAIFIPELTNGFNPMKYFHAEKKYQIEELFQESVLKCTSIPPKMPAMSVFNHQMEAPASHDQLIRQFPKNPFLTDPLEICQAAAHLTRETLSDDEEKFSIIGYLPHDELFATVHFEKYLKKWIFECQDPSGWMKPFGLIVKAPEILNNITLN